VCRPVERAQALFQHTVEGPRSGVSTFEIFGMAN
jgi:hypothetical protein